MKFEIGRTIGGYEFLDFLGSSKVDVSYKVRNVFAQRIELLRVLPKQDDPDLVGRFLREMKVHARLVHPNIVSFYDARELDGQLVMTIEFVEGTTLAQRLKCAPIDWNEAAGYMRQALLALAYAHSQQVVHRDITPESILVTPDGAVKLTCFGVAKAATDPNLTQAGAVRGALKYMSPEQVRGASGVDVRTDIYSLGAVLYEVVTGKPPSDMPSEFDMMLAHVNTVPAPPSSLNPSLRQECDVVVLTAMAKEPNRRFQTADEFREALVKTTQGTEGRQISSAAEAAAVAPASPTPALPPLSGPPDATAIITAQAGRAACPTASLDAPFFSKSFIHKPGFLDTGVLPSNWDRAQLTLAGIIMAVIVLLAFFTVVR